jgi:hypothetical protein
MEQSPCKLVQLNDELAELREFAERIKGTFDGAPPFAVSVFRGRYRGGRLEIGNPDGPLYCVERIPPGTLHKQDGPWGMRRKDSTGWENAGELAEMAAVAVSHAVYDRVRRLL